MQQRMCYLLQNKMKLKKSKKGSHVDVIVSFMIFIIFIIFLFIIINPTQVVEKDKKQTAEYIKLKIDNKIIEEIVIVNVANASVKDAEDCISLDESSLNISGMTPIAKDSNGNYAGTQGNLQIDWSSSSSFLRVYYSVNSFNTHTTDSSTCQIGEIKSVRYIQEAVETNITKLIADYATNYSFLKSEFGISNKEEFAIQFEFSNGTIIGTAPQDTKVDRYAEKYQKSYFDKEANKKSGYIILYIW